MEKERIIWFDLLKIFAILAVVFLHSASFIFIEEPLFSNGWHVSNIYDSLVRFCVPIFIMVSGALFLNDNKDIDIKKLYKKNIVRLLSAYIIWNVIYNLYNIYFNNLEISIINIPFLSADHMWFMPMIICLYIVTPILKLIVKDKKVTEYLLIVFIIFGITLPFIGQLAALKYNVLSTFISEFRPEITGYVGYYILGYYLYTYKPFKAKNVTFMLGYTIATIMCILGTIIASKVTSTKEVIFYDYFSLTTLIQAICIFLLFKYVISKKKLNDKVRTNISKIASYTFGIYLVHMLVFYELIRLGFDTSTMNSLIYIPLLGVSSILISLAIIFIISKIPILNKYMM